MRMREDGFTLIELVMVILIIAILSTVIITDIINSSSQAKLEGARWKFKSDLSFAQSLAVTQQLNHGIIFDPTTETYSVYRQNPSDIVNNPLTGNPFTVNYSQDTYFKGLDIVSTSFGSPTTNQVEFNNFGSPSDGTNPLTIDGSVTLSYQGSSVTITVTKNTGKVN